MEKMNSDFEITEIDYKKNPFRKLFSERKRFVWGYECPHGDNIEMFFAKYPELVGLCFPLAAYLHRGGTFSSQCFIVNYERSLSSYGLPPEEMIFALVECSCRIC